MTEVAQERARGRRDTPGRARVEQAALRLFADEGVSETSLQKIADALGVTKAAVYWHYKSKDEIVLAASTCS